MDYNQYRPARFNLLPEVVKNLLIINAIFFIATIFLAKQGIDLIDILGLHYFQSEKFYLYQFITYMFMHGGFAHIFFNMFALWMFGAALENVWGPRKFLTYFILTGLGAAVAHYAVVYFEMQPILTSLNEYIANPNPEGLKTLLHSEAFSKFQSEELINNYRNFIDQYNATIPQGYDKAMNLSVEYVQNLRTDILNAPVVVGASGAIFGLLLGYGMLFPDSLIYIYFALPIKAKYFVIIYGAIELFSGIANMQGDNVAHFAHLGGLVAGWIIIKYWQRKDRERRGNYFN